MQPLSEAPPLPLFAYGTLTDPLFVGRLLERRMVAEPAMLLEHTSGELPGLDYPVVVPDPGDPEEHRPDRQQGPGGEDGVELHLRHEPDADQHREHGNRGASWQPEQASRLIRFRSDPAHRDDAGRVHQQSREHTEDGQPREAAGGGDM